MPELHEGLARAEAATERNTHLIVAEAGVGTARRRRVLILRGYRGTNGGRALGIVAAANIHNAVQGDWAAYLGTGDPNDPDLMTRTIAGTGFKVSPNDPTYGAIVSAAFPELPLFSYRR